jgi:predicted exporter
MSLFLVISNQTDFRRRLNQLICYGLDSNRCLLAKSFSHAKKHIASTALIQSVIIDSRMNQEECADFFASYRKGRLANSCFIEVVCDGERKCELVADSMLRGFHGLLCEPLSFDSLQELTALAHNVQLNESSVRLRAATGLLLSQARSEKLNENGAKESESSETDMWERVQDACHWYKDVMAESLTGRVCLDISPVSPPLRMKVAKRIAATAKASKIKARTYFSSAVPSFTNRKK